LIVLTDVIGFGIILPLIPTISSKLNISGLALGLFTASYSLAQLISAPMLGSLSDKYGRKPILVISKAGTVLAYLILAFTNNYLLLIISRLIDGFTGGNIPAARAYISDITTKENRSKGMAIVGMAFGLGFISGPAIGGIFYSLFKNITAPALAGAALSFLSLVLTYFLLDESHRQNNPQNHTKITFSKYFAILTRPNIQLIMVFQLFLMICMAGYQTNLTLFTDKIYGFTPDKNSLLFIFIGIISVISQGVLIKKKIVRQYQTLFIANLVTAISVLLISINQSLLIFGILLGVSIASNSVVGVVLPSTLSTQSSTDPEGEIQGVFESAGALGRVIGPIIYSSFILLHPRLTFASIALMLIITTLPLFAKISHERSNGSQQ